MHPDVDFILKELKKFYSEERRVFIEKNAPTEMDTFGLSMPELKSVLKEYLDNKAAYSIEIDKSIIQDLLNSCNFEAQLFAYCWLDKKKKLLSQYTKSDILSLGKGLDNWVSVDYYGTLVFGHAWYIGEIDVENILQYQQSDNFWLRRLALCSLVGWDRARGKSGKDNPHFEEICKNAVSDYKTKIVQGLSWALRFHIPRNRKEVELFMSKYERQLTKRVLREVHNKLDTGLKN